MLRTPSVWLSLMPLAFLAGGCAQTTNPSFSIDANQARAELSRMSEEPKALQRPLVIIGGFGDPLVVPAMLRTQFESVSMNEGIVAVGVGECPTFDECRSKVIEAVDNAHPNGDPTATVEVDVIGLSMGGVVARYAALPMCEGQKRLRIARLFTVSSPLRGAQQARWTPAILPVIKDLRRNSSLLEQINETEPQYPVYSYVRLGDLAVGAENAALPGHVAWWVPTPPLESAHNAAPFDPRIFADIALRLRGEPPLAHDPPAPLPVH